jgi:hypothetical protein
MRFAVFAALAAVIVVMAALVAAPSSAPLAAGTLNLRASLRMVSQGASCIPGATGCRTRTGTGPISGLGGVTETYNWFYTMGAPSCPPELGKPLATTGRLVVAGKGEIQFDIAEGTRCIEEEPMRNEPQEFTITAGTGAYQGATGSGTLERNLNNGIGFEEWTGTLVVPGLEFDLAPPTLSGAKAKTVFAPRGAKSARVTYTVTASDAKDGRVPVTCVPRSGSRFAIGRTVVKCSATDSSGNTRSASFSVIVRAPR